MQLVPDPRGGRGGGCVVLLLLSFRSEWSQGFRICARLEVRPRPDVALFVCFFVLHYNVGRVIAGTALCLLTVQDMRAMERTETWGRLFFF